MPGTTRVVLAGICSAVLLTAGCTAAGRSSHAAACAVTRPTASAVPAGVRDQRYGPVFGHGALWVGAWWAVQPTLERIPGEHSYGVKYPSFTVRDGQVTPAFGPPLVRAKRLDGKGTASGDSGGYATATLDGPSREAHWWPTLVHFSDRGCWQVTETVAGTSLTYVVRI